MGAAGVPQNTVSLATQSLVLAGAIMGEINDEQRAALQARSPSTLVVIQRNDQVAAQQTTEPLLPLSVTDVEQLIAVGVKPDVIVGEIQKARGAYSYSQEDVDLLRQAYPNVDPTVTQAML
jgi:hypothetical protein